MVIKIRIQNYSLAGDLQDTHEHTWLCSVSAGASMLQDAGTSSICSQEADREELIGTPGQREPF